ncbi:hypothetical protein UFOVP75_182 [uncultured Caudovirales phage]|uniref:Uncharacterized protein n=1 Tax=uncultured Caudovirales phage TaxID=2100421 RepID=A0A6J5L693_9CAUD|nr:hypothetical protein UFOVP75_182 [uncultured Caudovirales phage]
MNTSTAELTRTPMSQPVVKQPTMLGLFIKDVAMVPVRIIKPLSKVLAYLAPSVLVNVGVHYTLAVTQPDPVFAMMMGMLASCVLALVQSAGSARLLSDCSGWDTFWIYRPIINYYINLKQRAGVQ